ncbi:MAG: amidase, partial [Clostridia bacterium]|nr:amidase [Clostridia bacterium]
MTLYGSGPAGLHPATGSVARPAKREGGGGGWVEDLAEAGLRTLSREIARGGIRAEELVEFYIDRIRSLDRPDPARGYAGVRSVVELNPEALEIARALDRERERRGVRGPLHGIPVLIKDNIDTGDRMQTTAGSLALLGPPAPEDATCVRRLREAGCVILGKANLSEWANFRSTNSLSGWSARGGLTNCPYALDRNPAGSSSGSAAAVSAGFAAVALGTETDGSIASPASACGVVGLKPGVGATSRAGVVPIAESQDTVGPIARYVADAALVLDAVAGPDPRDPHTIAFWRGRPAFRLAEELREDGLRGARLGVLRDYFGRSAKVDRLMEEALSALRAAGAELVDPVGLPSWKALSADDSEMTVLLTEFRQGVRAYLATRPGIPHRTLEDLIAFNEAHADLEMPLFGQELFEKAASAPEPDDPAYREALRRSRRLGGRDGIDAALAAHG